MSKLIRKLYKHRKEIMKEKLSKVQVEKTAWMVLHYLKNNNELSGRELADLIKVEPIDIRQAIQFLREHNHLFNNPSNNKYVVATNKGYKLTNNLLALTKYQRKLEATLKSKKRQLREIVISILTVQNAK